jgi:hypothetical protein
LYSKVDNVAVAADTLVLCQPRDAFLPQEVAERTAKNVISAMVIARKVAYFVPDTIVFKHWLKKLPLLSSTMAARTI